MRMLLTVEMDTEKANKAIQENRLGGLMRTALEPLRPEASYFGAKNGQRTAFIVFDLKEPSDIPTIAETFFVELGAKVEFIPVMNLDDVQSGLRKAGHS
ncbi:hypothetical protein LN042_26505 [Kitasatospora sp. RB6PN24]|uniref:hypothetical protein n=1 Tax=Kitasatospora humi TaxID=2893891 RepID=UPI001E5ADA69|nr:hypothetical protein [Kitasatospora humi]MCC9310579.1 hypothetical protein [Kitasatospora humi]